MTRHEERTTRRANMTKVVGLAGMAAAAATLAMTAGAGTAEARPGHFGFGPNPNNTSSTSTTSSTNTAAPNAAPTSVALSPPFPSFDGLYNCGCHIGTVTNPPLAKNQQDIGGVLVTPAVPGSRPFASVQGVQLPIWTVSNTGTPGTPVPFA